MAHRDPQQLVINKLIVQENNRLFPHDSGQLSVMLSTLNLMRVSPNTQRHRIELMNCTTNQAMEHYTSQGMKVAALNFANANTAGGGIELGSIAQEEALCRTSPMLYNSLKKFATPVLDTRHNIIRYKYNGWGEPNWDKHVIYSPKITFRRHDNTKKYNILNQPYEAAIITAAAPNMGKIDNFDIRHHSVPKLGEDIRRVIQHIYYAPISSKSLIETGKTFGETWKPFRPRNSSEFSTPNVLILGAWGCGAFAPKRNKTAYVEFMAKQFVELLKSVNKKYDIICFAIMNDGKPDGNYNVFKTHLNRLGCREVVPNLQHMFPVPVPVQAQFPIRPPVEQFEETLPNDADGGISGLLSMFGCNISNKYLQHENISSDIKKQYLEYKLKYINLKSIT